MVAGLDPHSQYFDKKTFKEFREGTSGRFVGVGIEINMEDGLVKVVSPIEGSPAFRAGLKPGDRWCVCALRWRETYEAGCAPPVVLESTHARALDFVLIEWLRKSAAPTMG
jgi:hypothetical protein